MKRATTSIIANNYKGIDYTIMSTGYSQVVIVNGKFYRFCDTSTGAKKFTREKISEILGEKVSAL